MAQPDDAEERRLFAQFMTTEHFVLQTAKAATIQEANWRASLFLTSVSSATVALAFVAQVTQMGKAFVIFSLILMPCLYFIGLVTFVRAVQVGIESMVHSRGLARIRHYYVERVPAMKPYLVHSTHDNQLAMLADVGLRPSRWQSFLSTPGMVNAINGAIAGVFTGVVAHTVAGPNLGVPVGVGVIAFILSIFLHWRYHDSTWINAERQMEVMFPSKTIPYQGKAA